MKIFVAATVPLALAACSPLEPLPLGAEPLSPTPIAVPAPAGPMVAYDGYRVVQPSDWRGVNDAQAGN